MEALTVKEIVKAVEGVLLSGDENIRITSVSTNSKELNEGALFVPIIGERVDAHQFIPNAIAAGAKAVFTACFPEKMVEGAAYIKVDNTLHALQNLAGYYRNMFRIPVVGITGSVGKTTTKEMIAAVLATQYQVVKTQGNMNSQVGLSLTLFGIEKKHQVAVVEMGMSEPGEMEKLAAIARPTISVITNIGVSHIGQLGSQENIRREKLNIIDENTENSVIYVNGQDALLKELVSFQEKLSKGERSVPLAEKTCRALKQTAIKSYGIGESFSYTGKNVASQKENTIFTYVSERHHEEVTLRVLGEHNVMNGIVALAIGEQLGIDPKVGKMGLYEYQPIAMRGQILRKNGLVIIDDTYNASPDSMKSGIAVLLSLEGVNRRVAVLADVLELGEASYHLHYQVGESIVEDALKGKKIDELVAIGESAKAIKEAVDAGKVEIKTNWFGSNQEAVEHLKETLMNGDAILVKGSRGMHTDEIVKVI